MKPFPLVFKFELFVAWCRVHWLKFPRSEPRLLKVYTFQNETISPQASYFNACYGQTTLFSAETTFFRVLLTIRAETRFLGEYHFFQAGMQFVLLCTMTRDQKITYNYFFVIHCAKHKICKMCWK
jgi:hypothetical protein